MAMASQGTAALLIFIISQTYGANILFYWSISGYSHRISVWPLVERLTAVGHNVTFFSPLPPKVPNANVTEVSSASGFKNIAATDFVSARIHSGPKGIEALWSNYLDFGFSNCEGILSDPAVIDWVKRSSYDLVVINSLLNDCGYGFAHKFKARYIIYEPTSPFGWSNDAYGYPDENYPLMDYHYPAEMTFMQRVWNGLRPLYWQFFRHWYTFPRIEAILKEKLNISDMPPISEMEKNSSLSLLYSHFSEEFPRSLPPSVIPIGGMHCTDNIKPLNENLTDFVDSGTDGFIYFSFGTFANISSITRSLKDTFFGAMGSFTNIRFIVKWHEDMSVGLPENIKFVTWAAQQDILGHPKIRAFISHGGLLGTQEALFHGVPMIVIPLFADQDSNAERVHSRGRGIKLEISDLTQDKLEGAIQEITTNTRYSISTRHASKIFKDRPTKPVDTALWWVEYVLRNEDTSHLKSHNSKKSWYEKRMLDIWGFMALVLIFGSFAILLIMKSLMNFIINNIFFPTKAALKMKKID